MLVLEIVDGSNPHATYCRNGSRRYVVDLRGHANEGLIELERIDTNPTRRRPHRLCKISFQNANQLHVDEVSK